MKRIQSQIEFYDKLAGTYEPQVDAEGILSEQRYRRLFPENARYKRGLDIGCGTGNWTRGLFEVCDSVLAIDSSTSMLDLCRGKLGTSRVSYQQVNAFDFPDLGWFDVVFSTFWISHVPLELQNNFWQWVASSLSPHGQITMLDSIDTGPGGGGHVRTLPSGDKYEIVKNRYEFEELLQTIRRNGIEASVITMSETLYVVSGKLI